MCLIVFIALKVMLIYLFIRKIYHSIVFLFYLALHIVLFVNKLMCVYACSCMHMQEHVPLSMHVYVCMCISVCEDMCLCVRLYA